MKALLEKSLAEAARLKRDLRMLDESTTVFLKRHLCRLFQP